MKTIAFLNLKGGVGKSTSVHNIGAALARHGHEVLMIDMDAQASLTFSCLPDRGEKNADRNIYHALTEKDGSLPMRVPAPHLWLCPSGIEMARLDMDGEARPDRLRTLLEAQSDAFNVVLIDCPPFLGKAATSALIASDEVIIPLTAEPLPLRSLAILEDFIDSMKRANEKLAIGGVLITRWKDRVVTRGVKKSLLEHFGDALLHNVIRENIALAEAPLAAQDIFSYSPRSIGAQDYEAVATELMERWRTRQ